MAEVITKLKVDNQGFDQKIKNAQRSLDQFGLKGSEAGKRLSGLTNMFTSGVTKIGPWGAALAAAGAAIKVVGDAFKSNEILADQWAGTMEGAKSVYSGFLNALNTGNFDSFFQNMKDIVKEAKEAYDALDNLGTFNAFQQLNIAKAQANFDQALVDFKAGKTDKTGVEAAKKAYQDILDQRAKMENEAYVQEIEKYAKSHNIDAKQLQQVLEGQYGDFDALKNTAMTGKKNGWLKKVFSGKKNAAANEQEAFALAIQQMTDEDVKRIQGMGMSAWKTQQESTGLDRRMQRIATEKKVDKAASGTAKAAKEDPVAGSIDAQQLKVQELQKQWEAAASDESRATIKVQLDEANAELDRMMGKTQEVETVMEQTFQTGSLDDLKNKLSEATDYLNSLTVGTAEWEQALEGVLQAELAVNEAQAKMGKGGEAMNVVTDDAKGTENAFRNAASAVSSVSGALEGMEDPGAKIAGIIGQAIATIALTFAGSMKGTFTPWDWIAAAAAGTATMIGTIAAIKSATSGYAEGGLILPNGSPYQGDNIVARLNAGEGVLTAQGIENAGRMASQTNIAGGTMGLRTEISGENLAIVLDNNNRRRGRSKSVR